MKLLLLLPLLVCVLTGASCRTMTPLDPMTMKPSEKCLPNAAGTTNPAK